MNLVKINHDIEDLINSLTDPETGEISEEAWEQIEALQLTKDELVTNYGMKFKKLLAEAEFWKAESKRLAHYAKINENIAERIKGLLSKSLTAGEKIKTTEIEIGWRKSEVVEIDELADMESLYKSHPELIKQEVSYKADKNTIKAYLKGGIGIKGIRLTEKQNIQIK